jgi:hypothetical protein
MYDIFTIKEYHHLFNESLEQLHEAMQTGITIH